jgi:hypothetical protein
MDQLAVELEAQFAAAAEQARREQAERLNQSVRRMAIAPDADELLATLSDAAARFASGVAVFRVAADMATNEHLAIPLASAPALSAAVESRDPLIAAAIPGEVGIRTVELYGHSSDSRVSIFPLVVGEAVPALIYAWGEVQGPAIELLAKVASAIWSAFPAPPTPAPTFVTITAAPAPLAPPKSASAWEDLSAVEQQIHLRAQRFARVQVARMRLEHAEAVQVGRSRRDLYKALHVVIEEARATFRAQFFAACPSMVDYLHVELTRTLANDNADLLGSNYPGPLV